MVARVIVGIAWSLVSGFAGGWLLLSPWALGEQPSSGDWTNVTKTQFWTGTGLVALAVIALAMVAAQVASAFRGAPAAAEAAPGPRGRTSGSSATNGEMDAALVALANALVADLNRQPAGPPTQYPQSPPVQPPGPPPTVQPNGPPAPYPQVPQPPAGAEPWRSGR